MIIDSTIFDPRTGRERAAAVMPISAGDGAARDRRSDAADRAIDGASRLARAWADCDLADEMLET